MVNNIFDLLKDSLCMLKVTVSMHVFMNFLYLQITAILHNIRQHLLENGNKMMMMMMMMQQVVCIAELDVYAPILLTTVYVYTYAKQKHLGCKKVRGQSEATLLTGMCNKEVTLPKLFLTP